MYKNRLARVCLCSILIFFPFLSSFGRAAEGGIHQANDKKIKALEQERLAALIESHALLEIAYRQSGSGKQPVSVDELIRSKEKLLDAQLQLSQTANDRMLVLLTMIKETRHLEKFAEGTEVRTAGIVYGTPGRPLDVPRLRVFRIELNILLEKEKRK